jgi:hypothetical protein
MKKPASDRRKSDRFHTRLAASWEGILTRRAGVVVDISATGCFILTRDDVQLKELIRIEIESPTGRNICLWGEVVYRAPEMGFALRFTSTDPMGQQMLGLLLEYLRESDREGARQTTPA